MRTRILIVDDNTDFSKSLKDRLASVGHEVTTASDGEEALDSLTRDTPELLLLDLQLPKLSGLEVLKHVRMEWPDLPVIIISAFNIVARAVEAIKAGADDFITKPLDTDHLDIAMRKVLDRKVWKIEKSALRTEIDSRYSRIIGESPQILEKIEMARKVAQSDATVLLLGETGTGKELFARKIHAWSARRDRLFYPINCVALAEELLESELFGHEKGAFTTAMSRKIGKFELADGGTVFLDEIGDMKASLQAKLLRFLEDQQFERVGGTKPIKTNIRVIAATNRDLFAAMQAGTFREDLYFRLNVVPITLPPLRERPDDVPSLAETFLDTYCQEAKRPPLRLSARAIGALKSHQWRGNVRVLKNVIERAVVLKTDGLVIEPDDLGLQSFVQMTPSNDEAGIIDGPFHEAVDHCKGQIIARALARSGGSRTKTAELLGLQRTHLSRLISKHLGTEEAPS